MEIHPIDQPAGWQISKFIDKQVRTQTQVSMFSHCTQTQSVNVFSYYIYFKDIWYSHAGVKLPAGV